MSPLLADYHNVLSEADNEGDASGSALLFAFGNGDKWIDDSHALVEYLVVLQVFCVERLTARQQRRGNDQSVSM